MIRLPVHAAAAMIFGLATAMGSPLAADAHPIGLILGCGSGWDYCMEACNYNVPGGPALGQCKDYCSTTASVCEASRIPRPASYRHSRYPTARK